MLDAALSRALLALGEQIRASPNAARRPEKIDNIQLLVIDEVAPARGCRPLGFGAAFASRACGEISPAVYRLAASLHRRSLPPATSDRTDQGRTCSLLRHSQVETLSPSNLRHLHPGTD